MTATSFSPTHRTARQHWARGWSVERTLFAVGGTMTAVSAALAAVVSPWFLLLTGFVALNQMLYATVGLCGAAAMLRRFTNLPAGDDA
jgi:hypothetical protein